MPDGDFGLILQTASDRRGLFDALFPRILDDQMESLDLALLWRRQLELLYDPPAVVSQILDVYIVGSLGHTKMVGGRTALNHSANRHEASRAHRFWRQIKRGQRIWLLAARFRRFRSKIKSDNGSEHAQ